jgi:DNA-binding NarL/FixJ family response regulator
VAAAACRRRYPRCIGAEDDFTSIAAATSASDRPVVRFGDDELQAIVADELELVRVGLTAALAPLGVGVCAECRSGREAAETSAFVLPDLVVVGALSDGSTLDGLRRLAVGPVRPRLVGLFPRAGDPEAGAAVALGVEGIGLRSSSFEALSTLFERVIKGEAVVLPELNRGLVGGLEGAVVDVEQPGDSLLSAREREMLHFLAAGRSNREIADALSISLATVKSHLVRLYSKLEVGNRNEALSRAVALGVLR